MAGWLDFALARDDIEQIKRQLARVEAKLDRLIATQIHTAGKIAMSIEDLRAEIERGTTIVERVEKCLQGLIQQVTDAKDNPAALDALIAQLKANHDRLVDAVAKGEPEGAA